MTGEKTTPKTRTAAGTFKAEREPGKALSRDEIAGMLSDVLKKLHARITAPQFRPKESDSELMAVVRGFVQASTAFAGVLKDRDLDEIERRAIALEQQKERESPNRTR